MSTNDIISPGASTWLLDGPGGSVGEAGELGPSGSPGTGMGGALHDSILVTLLFQMKFRKNSSCLLYEENLERQISFLLSDLETEEEPCQSRDGCVQYHDMVLAGYTEAPPPNRRCATGGQLFSASHWNKLRSEEGPVWLVTPIMVTDYSK